MNPHRMSRWARLVALCALVPALAWAQDGPGERLVTIEPTEPVDRTAGTAFFSWDVMDLSGVAPGSVLATLWVNAPDDVFVWATRPVITVTPETLAGRILPPDDPTLPPGGAPPAAFSTTSTLLRYDGVRWAPVLEREGETAATLFASHRNEVYAATTTADGLVHVYHFNGNRWRTEALPEGITGPAGDFAGDQARLFLRAGNKILMAIGPHWSVVYENDLLVPGHALVVLDRNQIVAPGIHGQATWDGTRWTWTPLAWNMDVHGAFGARDAAGELHLFATGHGPDERGMCVQQFLEDSPGCLRGCYIEAQPEPAADPHSGTGIEAWGTGPHDVYLVGRVHDEGILERFNGVAWSRIVPIADMTVPTSVSGTVQGDLWIALRDGRILRGQRGAPIVTPIDADDDVVVAPAAVRARREASRTFVLEYGLTEGQSVVGAVFDVRGRRVAVLENGHREAGMHQVRWNAQDVRPGVYFYRLRAGALRGAARMIVEQ